MGLTTKFCERGNKCSCWFDGWFGKDWSSCCAEHDDCYRELNAGDSTKSCDTSFLACLKAKAGAVMAYVMFGAVRVFGREYR